MNALDEVIAKLKKIKKTANKMAENAIIEERDYLAKLNREQLESRKDTSGIDTPKYAKGSKQPSAPGRMTFKDTGDFHRDIKPEFEAKGFKMKSSKEFLDPFRVSTETLGLTPESKTKVGKRIIPQLRDQIRRL